MLTGPQPNDTRASLITILSARIARHAWMERLKKALAGETPEDFQPLMRDVRALAERLAGERDYEQRGGPWSSQRLRSTLAHYLEGERVVVLANREPYVHEHGEEVGRSASRQSL